MAMLNYRRIYIVFVYILFFPYGWRMLKIFLFVFDMHSLLKNLLLASENWSIYVCNFFAVLFIFAHRPGVCSFLSFLDGWFSGPILFGAWYASLSLRICILSRYTVYIYIHIYIYICLYICSYNSITQYVKDFNPFYHSTLHSKEQLSTGSTMRWAIQYAHTESIDIYRHIQIHTYVHIYIFTYHTRNYLYCTHTHTHIYIYIHTHIYIYTHVSILYMTY